MRIRPGIEFHMEFQKEFHVEERVQCESGG
jgi:hypothetical protein